MLKSLRNFVIALLAGASGCSTASPQSGSQPPSDVRGDATINSPLLKLLHDHGLDATHSDGWILVPAHPRICGAVVRENQPRPRFHSIQIDIYLEVEPGRTLVESFGGFGTTREEAVADGMHNFAANSFHVLLAAFYIEPDNQVETEQWLINGERRQVTIGGMGVRGKPPLPDEPPIAWFKDLERKIKGSSLPVGTHWVRCYYAQMQSRASAVEVLLDNDEWASVQSEMADLDWPKCEDFYSVRIFLVIQDPGG